MSGIYIHIPFCRRKCYYCEFYSVGSLRAPWREYADAILAEARVRKEEIEAARPNTLYIGGGTPSQMPVSLLAGIVDLMCSRHKFREITVEVNPEDVTEELCTVLATAGVDRISMGIQSFNDAELKAVGRRHSAAQAMAAYELIRRHFDNVSIDLIFGLPLQTLDTWQTTLNKAVSLSPEHISAYSLMWEERAALCKMRQLGKVTECDEDLSERMFVCLVSTLRDAGYKHYEISNFAKSRRHSLHNSSYWLGEPYIGLGAAAHSYDGRRIRRANPADVKNYITHYQQSRKPFYEEELLSDEELVEEYIMTRLRRAEGISLADFQARFGLMRTQTLINKAKKNPSLLQTSNKSIILTKDAVMRSDTAILELI